jgi:hypothetical protein
MMKSINRRIRKLEEKYGLGPVETEFSRRLRERIEEGRRRLGEARERGEWSGSVGNDDGENRAGLSVTEVLHLGRARVARVEAERDKAQQDIAREGNMRRLEFPATENRTL